MTKISEECGVFGIYCKDIQAAADAVYYALYALQHRGQESCGIALNKDGYVLDRKDIGLVNDVFDREMLSELAQTVKQGKAIAKGKIDAAIGHVHYGSIGRLRVNTQPMVVRHSYGDMAVAFNGGLTNARELRNELELKGAIFQAQSDAEVIAYVITRERMKTSNLQSAVRNAMEKFEGAYSIVITSEDMLVCARDPHGFRPLCIGHMEDGYVFASETCALNALGAAFVRDVLPGEMVTVNAKGIHSDTHLSGTKPHSLCVFEYIYFARPDSIVDGQAVHLFRQKLGALLAAEYKIDADVVIGVPDSGLDGAIGYAGASGIPNKIGFIKNRYIGRGFTEQNIERRLDDVKIKLNPIPAVVKDQRVIMVDDSIVQGTTSEHIVKLLRDAGAIEVHVLITAPPFVNICYYGTDVGSVDRLISTHHDEKEIAKIIGADSLNFLKAKDIKKLGNELGIGLCDACFTGNYPVWPQGIKKSRYESRIYKDAEQNIHCADIL